MAVLGHTARLAITTPSLDAFLEDLLQLEFDVQDQFATDGQILLSCQQGPERAYQLAYQSDRPTPAVPDGLGLPITVTAGDAGSAIQRTGERNPLLGYLDAIVVPSTDPLANRRALEDVGFFVLEEFVGTNTQSDVTDGLVTLSLASHARKPFLQYRQELTAAVLADLHSLEGIACTMHLGGEQLRDGVSHMRLTLRDGFTIVVIHDGNYE